MAVKTILVQAGHNPPREPGFESGTGTVREIEFTAAMQKRVVSLLRADTRFAAIPQPGDLTDVKCDAALFFHGDGSPSKAATGRSMGFPDLAGRDVNEQLAGLLDRRLADIPGAPPKHIWNYTAGLSGYYGYRRITTPGPEVLIEFGFLTNPAEQKWLFAHLAEQANAVYLALCDYWQFKPQASIGRRRVGWVVTWVENGETKRRRTMHPGRLFRRLWDDGLRQKIVIRKRTPIRAG